MKPADIREVHRILMEDFHANPAPIVDFIATQGRDPFKILVATLLSARTRDQTTAHVVRDQLFPVVRGFDDLRRLTLPEIERLIFPVGFYHQKAKALHAMPDVVRDRFGGAIPDTVEALCELPGVGRKTANLVVALAFEKPAICVDIHVHRITNRLGLVKTKTPLETEMARAPPEDVWTTWNACFVPTPALPTRRPCDACRIRSFCLSPGSLRKAYVNRPPHAVISDCSYVCSVPVRAFSRQRLTAPLQTLPRARATSLTVISKKIFEDDFKNKSPLALLAVGAKPFLLRLRLRRTSPAVYPA